MSLLTEHDAFGISFDCSVCACSLVDGEKVFREILKLEYTFKVACDGYTYVVRSSHW
jgi:hypothetical protein